MPTSSPRCWRRRPARRSSSNSRAGTISSACTAGGRRCSTTRSASRTTARCTAIQLRGYSSMGGYRKNSGVDGRRRALQVRQRREHAIIRSTPTRPCRAISAVPNFRKGIFGIQSMMDDVAYKMKMDPVEFGIKNMVRTVARQGAVHQLHAGRMHSPRRRAFDWKARWRPEPGSDTRSDQARRRIHLHVVPFGRRLEQRGRADRREGPIHVFVGVTDVGAGAKTTMGIIAADELGVPLSQVEVVWGDTDRCPYSVGESGSRTTIMTGYAVIEAVARSEEADRREGHADRQRRSSWPRRRRSREHGQACATLRRAFRRGRGRYRARSRAHHEVRRPCTTAAAS